MLSLLPMLITDTALMDMAMDMVMDADMPTTVIPDTLMPTVHMDMDIIIKLLLYFVKNRGFSSVKLVTPSHIAHC